MNCVDRIEGLLRTELSAVETYAQSSFGLMVSLQPDALGTTSSCSKHHAKNDVHLLLGIGSQSLRANIASHT